MPHEKATTPSYLAASQPASERASAMLARKTGTQHIACLVEKAFLAGNQQADDLPLGDADAERSQQLSLLKNISLGNWSTNEARS
jgi:hypothetical protein